ncbi:MAG: hypothetical protein HY247_05880 [archaeon]|nr:MAG: hypothetical protein HY247_05880 [archaeon]
MTAIKPVIEGTDITSVEVGNTTLKLKQTVSLDSLQELISAVENFSKFFDLTSLGSADEGIKTEWNEQDLTQFLSKETREDQIVALKVLSDKGEVTREEFLNEMKKLLKNPGFRGWDLGGLLAGLSIRSRTWGYESPYIKEERREGNEWDTFYRIKERYAPLIKKWLKERGP